MALIGLLITRDDDAIFETWCTSQLALYDAVVCLDGSSTEATARIAARFRDQLHYLHERDFSIPHKTDHGLRRVVHQEIVRRVGPGHWIMCCHADEFCYHDPRKIAALAEKSGYDLVSWYSPNFYPHPSELKDWERRRSWPVPERHRFYHWGNIHSGLPWIEDRLYREGPGVEWDAATHGSVRPHGLRHPAPFHPIFRHFKVIANDTAWCEVIGESTYYRHHWPGLEHRTGVPFPVGEFEDLFVDHVPKYSQCDRFDGVFDQPWNLGEELRPDHERFGPSNDGKNDEAAPASEAPATSAIHSRSDQARDFSHRLSVALGPENPAFGSWNWLGVDLAQELAADHEILTFRDEVPAADVIVFFKFLPDLPTLRAVHRQSTILFCPVDVYGSSAEIDRDADRLRVCDHVVVHCRRLLPYFQSYVRTSYCDHHLKYVISTRTQIVEDGPILWVGERSNLPPLVEWVNSHSLPTELVLLTNTNAGDSVQSLGFSSTSSIQLATWSPNAHQTWLSRCRAAIDVKGDDFRSRHKPPAKALDYLASGIPLAVTSPHSSRDHLLHLGFELADPRDVRRWLSAEYATECQYLGRTLTATLSLTMLAEQWRELLRQVHRRRRGATPRSV